MASNSNNNRRKSGIKKIVTITGRALARRPRTSVAQRKAEWESTLDNFDVNKLAGLQTAMSEFVDLITVSVMEDGVVLTEAQKFTLVTQALARRDIAEFMDVVLWRLKDIVWSHLNSKLAEEGVEDPENTNGEIEVPALGMKLCREGMGYNDPVIDEELLKERLGDLWEKVYTCQVIPEQTVYTLDPEGLLDLLKSDPSLVKKIEDAIIPGSPKNGRLILRPI